MTEVTVVTATIPGREDKLEECKASVAAQTVPCRHEVYLDRDRKGIQWGMNLLRQRVRTPWMQWLADDDLLMPHHVETLLPYTEDFDIIHSYCEVTGREGFLPNYSFEESGGWMTATALMRHSFVQKVGGWHPTAFPEDHYFWLRCAENGARFAVHREPTWIYRFHGGNLTFGRAT